MLLALLLFSCTGNKRSCCRYSCISEVCERRRSHRQQTLQKSLWFSRTEARDHTGRWIVLIERRCGVVEYRKVKEEGGFICFRESTGSHMKWTWHSFRGWWTFQKNQIFEKQKAPAGPCEAESKTFDIYDRVIVSGSWRKSWTHDNRGRCFWLPASGKNIHLSYHGFGERKGEDMLFRIPIFSKSENRKICELRRKRRKRSLTSMLYMSFLR
jgi:hypothetical protein